MDATSYSNFRQNLKDYMKQVNDSAEPLFVTSKDPKEDIIVMSKRDYDALQETMQILMNQNTVDKISRGNSQFGLDGDRHD